MRGHLFRMHIKTKTYVWVVMLVLVGMGGYASSYLVVHAEESVDDIRGNISDIEKKLKKAEEKKAALEREVGSLTTSLSQTERAIRETRIKIEQAENTIERKEAEIELLGAQIDEERMLLVELLRDLYAAGQTTLPELLLAQESFADLINHPDQLLSVKERVQFLLDSLENRQQTTATEKDSLESLKADHQELLAEKTSEKRELAAERAETLEDVADQEKIISRLQKELKELQGDLSTLTGKSYNARDIRQAVEEASGETGVPQGVLYGFLKMETNLGANTGQCTYEQVEKVSVARYKKYGSKYKSSIALLYRRRDIFYDLVGELGYNKNKKVSCSPNYIGQGGAMGVSQFMADVWRGYEADISAKTGHKNPDPWSLTDGVMAMALKLRKAGATSDKESVIRKASINYLGNFNNHYYSGIAYWAKNYKKLFN